MEVRLTPDLEAKLNQLSAETGRAKEELVQDAMAGYLAELFRLRDTLDSRYDDIKSGRVKPIDGERFSPVCDKRKPIIAIAKACAYSFHPEAFADSMKFGNTSPKTA